MPCRAAGSEHSSGDGQYYSAGTGVRTDAADEQRGDGNTDYGRQATPTERAGEALDRLNCDARED
eukprot:4436786-Prymnesium_polylepis.1